ncbi:MAG TPA: Hsp20/alpha crystallin family protein [Balneolales bacterium]|nr:Hsp20/alpha crystallin family protein [Balneolales bacterium]
MKLTKYSPVSPAEFMDLPNARFSDFLDEFFNDALARTDRDTFIPNVDISEDNDSYHIEVALPGLNKDDIKMDLKDRTLTISGERKFEKEKKDKRYHLMESGYGKFSRSFDLSDDVDKDSIDAQFKDGILYIDLKKTEEKVSKQIKIK